jgi:hypothetical protein
MDKGRWKVEGGRRKEKIKFLPFLIFLLSSILYHPASFSAEKQWSGVAGDNKWASANNWFSVGVPAATDNVFIDAQGLSLNFPQYSFQILSLTLGGRQDPVITLPDFTSGAIRAAANTDTALYLRKGSTLLLSGNGDIALKGGLKFSEETLPDEPAFMAVLQ